MVICEICGKSFSGRGYLQCHLITVHHMSILDVENYYIQYFKKDGEGIDPITGNKTEFIGLGRGYKRFEKNNSKKFATNTVEHFMLKGLSYEEAKARVDYVNECSSNAGKKLWEKAKQEGKTRGGWSKKHFLELGYSEEDAELEVKKRASIREEKMSEHRRNARESGAYKLYSPVCIEYWLNKGMTESDAKLALKKRQTTNTPESYIKKYGEELGMQKFIERNRKWSDMMEERYHEGEYSRDSNLHGNGIINKNYSNTEKELCCEINDILQRCCSNSFSTISISTSGKQWYIYSKDNKKWYFYDFMFISNGVKKIIEFNGDYWHMNPNIYSKDDINKSLNMSAGEIWAKFDEKIKVANDNGIDTFVVWETDWNRNKDKILNDCITFLLNS